MKTLNFFHRHVTYLFMHCACVLPNTIVRQKNKTDTTTDGIKFRELSHIYLLVDGMSKDNY